MKINITKMIGSFITILAILLLLFSIFDLFNKIDYINEYNLCTEISNSDAMLSSCRTNASVGLGFKIRENQLGLSASQYFMICLMAAMKILFSITILILGTSFYANATKASKTVSKPVTKKKKKR